MFRGIEDVTIIFGIFLGKVVILVIVCVYDIEIEVVFWFVLLFIVGVFVVFDKILGVDCVRVEFFSFICVVGLFDRVILVGRIGFDGERKMYILLIFRCW